eukprot:3863676-Amphidinium_carterae.4
MGNVNGSRQVLPRALCSLGQAFENQHLQPEVGRTPKQPWSGRCRGGGDACLAAKDTGVS